MVRSELIGECLTYTQEDVDSYHPYRYPYLNLGLTIDMTTPFRSVLRYEQDAKSRHIPLQSTTFEGKNQTKM